MTLSNKKIICQIKCYDKKLTFYVISMSLTHKSDLESSEFKINISD